MFIYTENGNVKFISKNDIELPFYTKEFNENYNNDSEIIKDTDFICIDRILSFIDNGNIKTIQLGNDVFEILKKYKCGLYIDNGGYYFKGGNIDEQKKEENIIIINKEFQNAINQFTVGYSQAEIDTWNEKQTEANIVFDGGVSTFLESLCIEGETVEELANKIIQNAGLFKTAYANAEVIKREALKAL